MFKWILVIFPCLLQCVSPYPGGAPKFACKSMVPEHGADPQSSKSPVTVKAENVGDSLKVTIEDSVSKTAFRGFLLKALDANGLDIANGKFASNDKTQTLDCGEGSQAALTHNSREEKANVITTWSPPGGFEGSVTFRATIVVEGQKFWVGVMSNPVTVKKIKTVMETTKNTNMPTSSVLPTTDIYSGCGSTKGCFGLPRDCVVKRSCEVVLTYANVPNSGHIHFQLVGALGARSGWIAMGLSRNDKMGDDSVTECALVQGKVIVRESWNFAKPRKGNFILPGPLNITDDEGEYEDGVITCSWNRLRPTSAQGHIFDLSVDRFYILLARGPVDDSGQKLVHNIELPSAYPVNLTSASVVVGKLSVLIKIHGAFMTAAWIGFVSVGILLARHYKEVWTKYQLCGGKVWFSIHRCFMLLSVGLIVGGFIAIFIDVSGWSEVSPNPHPILGCIATGLAVLQPLIAACRPSPTSPNRPIFRWIHGLVGNGGQLIAVVNMFFAVSLKTSNVPQAFNWVLVTFIIFHCLVHLLIHIHSCFMTRERARGSTTKVLGSTKINQIDFSDSYEVPEEAPGSAFKKFTLGLYSLVNIGLSSALVLMICLN